MTEARPGGHGSRATAWEWAQTIILIVNLAWTALCLGGFRPETMVVTSALTGALLVTHFSERAFGFAPATFHHAGWLLLPFLAYALINVLWITPVPWLGWFDWFGWAQMAAVFWVVLNGIQSRMTRRAVFFCVVLLALAGVALGCYQRFLSPAWLMLGQVQTGQFVDRASGSFGIPNSLAALFLLVLPALGALTLRRDTSAVKRVWWGWMLAVILFGLFLTISRGAWIGLALALCAWPLIARRGRIRSRMAFAAVTFAAVLLAGAWIYVGSPKVRERFTFLVRDFGELTRPIMWRASWNLFREHPAWGSGAGSYNIVFERHRPEGFRDEPQWTHNDYLNTLSDYGGVGFGLFFAACGVIAWRCRRATAAAGARSSEQTPRGSRMPVAALAIGLLAFALQLFVDFHLKIPALAMIFAAFAALAVAGAWTARGLPSTSTILRRVACGVVAAAGGGVIVFMFVPKYRAEGLRYRAHQIIDQLAIAPATPAVYRDRLTSARMMLERAVEIDRRNAQAWSDLSYAASLRAHVEPGRDAELGREAEAHAERALALSQVCHEFWIRRGVARDMQGRWLEGGNDTSRALDLAPNNAFAWYYHAYHLSLKRSERGLAEAALAFCLRLDPWNPAGLALRQRLAISRKSP